MAFEHVSVLLNETVDGLNAEADMPMKCAEGLAVRGDL